MHPYLAAFSKNAGIFWWRQCWWSQTIETKATRALQQPNIFFNVEGHEDVVWLSTSSMINHHPLRTALKTKLSGLYKLLQNYAWNFRIKTLWLQNLSDQLKAFHRHSEDFSTPIQICLKHLIISEVKQKVMVMQLHEAHVACRLSVLVHYKACKE